MEHDQAENKPNREAEREQTEAESGRSGAVGASEPDAVEAALAQALTAATTAARWELVAQLAGELEARRRARLAVPDLASERAKRERK